MRTITLEAGEEDGSYDLIETLTDGTTKLIATVLFGLRRDDVEKLRIACLRALKEIEETSNES